MAHASPIASARAALSNHDDGCRTCRRDWNGRPGKRCADGAALKETLRKATFAFMGDVLPYHAECVICQNEDAHTADRPHVFAGQE